MNVRLKSPAKEAVQSAGHALPTGAGPEVNQVDTTDQGMY